MDWSDMLYLIDVATAPDVMTKEEALAGLEELSSALDSRMECLKDEIHQDQIKDKEGDQAPEG